MLYARCTNCDGVHRLGDRPTVPVNGTTTRTTQCPDCGDQSYRSVTPSTETQHVERERLQTALDGVDGVGITVTENVVDHFGHVEEVCDAGVSGLTTVPYVGQETAEAIIDAVT